MVAQGKWSVPRCDAHHRECSGTSITLSVPCRNAAMFGVPAASVPRARARHDRRAVLTRIDLLQVARARLFCFCLMSVDLRRLIFKHDVQIIVFEVAG